MRDLRRAFFSSIQPLRRRARFGCMKERNRHEENEQKRLRLRVLLDRNGTERYNYYAIIGEKERN